MFLTRFRPSTEVDSFFSDFLPVFKGWVGENGEKEGFRLPKTNVSETDQAFILTMEMPGVEKKDVDVAIEKDHIVITGGKTEEAETKGIRREIRSAKFRRSFLLDSTVSRDNIKAKLENGVLEVTLPKVAEKVGRKVNID